MAHTPKLSGCAPSFLGWPKKFLWTIDFGMVWEANEPAALQSLWRRVLQVRALAFGLFPRMPVGLASEAGRPVVLGPHILHMTAIPGTTNVFDAFACGRKEGRREHEAIKSENQNLRADNDRLRADNERLRADVAHMHEYLIGSE